MMLPNKEASLNAGKEPELDERLSDGTILNTAANTESEDNTMSSFMVKS